MNDIILATGNINECAGEFTMVGDRCLSVPVDSLIWRRAVEACNERNSTLFYVDTVTKFNALVGLMREKNLSKFLTCLLCLLNSTRVPDVTFFYYFRASNLCVFVLISVI